MRPFAVKGSHCSYCGAYFLEQESFPRKCIICDKITHSNPLPVSVTIIRTLKEENGYRVGILIIQRAIAPQIGEWALPGGYLVTGESWQEGSAREIKEEIGISLNPADIKCYDVVNSSTNSNLLIFNTYNKIITFEEIEEIHFKPNEEVSDIDICYLPSKLAFPSHTKYLEKYLEEVNG
jgi:8-oxo-dGTP pyrophosphatase MutT (NUDIX family)